MKRVMVFTVLIATGLAFLLFPQMHDWYAHVFGAPEDLQFVRSAVPQSDAELAFAAANEYNQKLAKLPYGTKDPADYAADDRYLAQLQLPNSNGAMAELVIPKINVDLPIYHGTGAYELEHGVGHLYGSSLPVGGESTHTALTAHAGIPGSELFTRLGELKVGDEFSIYATGQAILYRVTDVRTVLPDEIDSLAVVPGQDLATLITCTPIGINSHRLLVTGTRISDEIAGPVTPPSRWAFPTWAPILTIGTLAAFLVAKKFLFKPGGAR